MKSPKQQILAKTESLKHWNTGEPLKHRERQNSKLLEKHGKSEDLETAVKPS